MLRKTTSKIGGSATFFSKTIRSKQESDRMAMEYGSQAGRIVQTRAQGTP
jgi:hypothetical protein